MKIKTLSDNKAILEVEGFGMSICIHAAADPMGLSLFLDVPDTIRLVKKLNAALDKLAPGAGNPTGDDDADAEGIKAHHIASERGN